MITMELINAYWNLVTECIVKIHNIGNFEAEAFVYKLRQSLQSAQYDSMTYHTEPYVVAWELATGKTLSESEEFYEHSGMYSQLVLKHLGVNLEFGMQYGK